MQADPSPAPLLSTEALVGPVIDASLDAVVIADLEGTILRANPAADAIFGHAPGSMIGKPIGGTIVPPHLRAAHNRGMAHHARLASAKSSVGGSSWKRFMPKAARFRSKSRSRRCSRANSGSMPLSSAI
ncbi:MAG: PAS domain S-box protein [Novosphingobium sp.]|uniref:PAS domain S-box protein n=1 Tax=Novosphingobium sp. TaxID=1874826 RepID=UPI00301B0AE4